MIQLNTAPTGRTLHSFCRAESGVRTGMKLGASGQPDKALLNDIYTKARFTVSMFTPRILGENGTPPAVLPSVGQRREESSMSYPTPQCLAMWTRQFTARCSDEVRGKWKSTTNMRGASERHGRSRRRSVGGASLHDAACKHDRAAQPKCRGSGYLPARSAVHRWKSQTMQLMIALDA